jgi:hypothetical protein
MQGWQASDMWTLEPAHAVGFHHKGRDARLVTLCSLIGPCEQWELTGNDLEMTFEGGAKCAVQLLGTTSKHDCLLSKK